MIYVKTVNEAQSYFLSNSSGSVIATNAKGDEKECDNYPEAEDFIQGRT